MARHPKHIGDQLDVRNQYHKPPHGWQDTRAECAGQEKETRQPDGIDRDVPQFLKDSLAEQHREAMKCSTGERSQPETDKPRSPGTYTRLCTPLPYSP